MAKRSEPTYRQLQEQLDGVVVKLEDPALDVDEATAAHAEGLQLIKQLQAKLEQADTRIIKAQADFTEQ